MPSTWEERETSTPGSKQNSKLVEARAHWIWSYKKRGNQRVGSISASAPLYILHVSSSSLIWLGWNCSQPPLGPCSCLICIYRCSTLIKKKNCKLCLQMFNHLCCSFELNSASLHLAKCLRSLELWTWLEMGFVLGKRKQLCRLLVTC